MSLSRIFIVSSFSLRLHFRSNSFDKSIASLPRVSSTDVSFELQKPCALLLFSFSLLDFQR